MGRHQLFALTDNVTANIEEVTKAPRTFYTEHYVQQSEEAEGRKRGKGVDEPR